MKYLALTFLLAIFIATPLSAKPRKIYVTEKNLISIEERLYVVLGKDKAYRLRALYCSDNKGYYIYSKHLSRVKARAKNRH